MRTHTALPEHGSALSQLRETGALARRKEIQVTSGRKLIEAHESGFWAAVPRPIESAFSRYYKFRNNWGGA